MQNVNLFSGGGGGTVYYRLWRGDETRWHGMAKGHHHYFSRQRSIRFGRRVWYWQHTSVLCMRICGGDAVHCEQTAHCHIRIRWNIFVSFSHKNDSASPLSSPYFRLPPKSNDESESDCDIISGSTFTRWQHKRMNDEWERK